MTKKPKILATVFTNPSWMTTPWMNEKLNVMEDFFEQCKQCRNMKGHISFPKIGENKYVFTCEKFLTEEIPCPYYMPEKLFQCQPLLPINRYTNIDMNEEEAKYCLLKSLAVLNNDDYLAMKMDGLGNMYGRVDNETNQQIVNQLLSEIQDHIKENYPFINVDVIK